MPPSLFLAPESSFRKSLVVIVFSVPYSPGQPSLRLRHTVSVLSVCLLFLYSNSFLAKNIDPHTFNCFLTCVS